MSESWVKVGAKCVCVNRGAWPSDGRWLFRLLDPLFGKNPTFGTVYVVTAIYPFEGDPFIMLRGLKHWFRADEFRPIITRTEEQDIEMFLPLAVHAKIDATTEQLERAWRESDHVIADDQSLRWIEDHPRKDDSK